MQTIRPTGWLVAPIAGAAALTIWGMLFWGVLYDPLQVFHDKSPAIEEAAGVLAQADTPTGTYFHPWPRDTAPAMEAWLAQHRAGPFFKLSYVAEGIDPQSPGKMLRGIGLYILIGFIATALLAIARLAPQARLRSAAAVFLGGVMGTLMIQVGDPVWFHLPWDYVAGNLVFELVAWAMLGAAVAWGRDPVLRRRRVTP
jgi:hypothetical protein